MIRSLLVATQFLTRLPTPPRIVATEEEIGRAAGMFPLIGAAIGAGGALLFWSLSRFVPPSVCVVFLLVYLAVITGAFHEDGLADSLDGFGGGVTREDKLRIMRDSRIGTFGALGLVLLILAKYNLLVSIEWPALWRSLVIAQTASRWTAIPLCMWLPYAREQGQGGLVARRIGPAQAVTATLTLVLTLLLTTWLQAVMTVAVAAAIVAVTGWYYKRRLNGITGDCLGATNQLVEVAVYLTGVIAG
jgi:adenosylcobinamide-GDP ribazoletransferase